MKLISSILSYVPRIPFAVSALALGWTMAASMAFSVSAQVNVSTLAGSTPGFANGTGTAAQFNQPQGVAVDDSGNVYVADRENDRIRKITPAGVVITFAGSGVTGTDNGNGTAAQFNQPKDVAVDGSGNVYVADSDNHLIRKITPAGVVSTFAGSGVAGTDNGNGTAAQFSSPTGVAVDGSDTVYVADNSNHLIRKITPAGDVSTFAGSGGIGSANGNGTAATFTNPQGLAIDDIGNVYVADSNNDLIRKITPAGDVSTYAGAGASGSTDGLGTAATFNFPYGVAVDGNGNVYVADFNNHRIRKITVPLPAIALDPMGGNTLDFSTVTVGQTSPAQTVTITNNGDAVLTVTGVALGGTDAAQFAINEPSSAPPAVPFTVAASGGTRTVEVTYQPQAAAGHTATLTITSDDPNKGSVVLNLTGTGQAPSAVGATLAISTVFVGPGATSPKVDITLTNNSGKPIAGLQYSVDLTLANNTIVTLDKTDANPVDNVVDLLDVSMLPAGFQASATIENDTLKVVIFTTGSNTIASGDTVNVGKICFTVQTLTPGGSAPAADLLGQAKALNLINDPFLLISDEDGVKVDGVTLENGEIQVGILGDLTGSPTTNGPIPDGLVDVRDIVVLVNEILGTDPLSEEGSVGFNIRNAATGDNPEALNVTDAIAIVNIILDIQPLGKAIASGPVGVSLGSVVTLADGSPAIPVLLEGNGVAGLQASFSFNPSLMSIGTPVLSDNTDGLMLDSRVENGTLQLIALSLSGQTLTAGQTVLIPVTLLGAAEASITMTDLIASSVYAQTIPVQLGTVVQPVSGKGTSTPASFSLNAAAPNPFNPATTISYEVPQSAHIQLTVYNLLGQEVVRLVDQVQAAGRYEVTWHAINAKGASVASGVYMYRLTSSSGYADSRRMTLLK